MMLQTTQNAIIFPSVPIDKGISFANLGMFDYADKKTPRNKSDVDTSISIPIGSISAIRAFKDNRCRLMTTSASTTDLACVRRWDSYNSDTVLPSYLSKCHFKLVIRHPFDFSVGFPMQSAFTQTLQIFNSNISIILICKIYNFMCNLKTSGFDKVRLISFHLSKFLSSFRVPFFSQFLENTPSDTNVSLAIPNIPPQIQLFEYFTVFIDNAQCNKCSTPPVYANNNIISFFDDELLFYADQYFPVKTISFKLKSGKCPSFFKELFKTVPGTILSYWKTNSFVQSSNNSNRVFSFGIFQISRPGNIVRNARSFNAIRTGFMPHCKNIFEQIYNYLGLQTSHIFDVLIFKFLKIVSCHKSIRCNNIPIPQSFKTMIGTVKPFLLKLCKRPFFGIGQRKYIQGNGFCHQHNLQHILWTYLIYKSFEIKSQNAKITFLQFFPRINSLASVEVIS